MLKPLPIGIQTYSDLIAGGFLYIDKTEYIYNMIKHKGYYFLSRPRRFGKSLLISTLDAVFSGKKELFKGLWIEKAEYDWQKYPVIRLDFTKIESHSAKALSQSLIDTLIKTGKAHNMELDPTKGIKYIFADLIERLASENKVVILADEYDKPIMDNITKLKTAKENREILKSFFGILKGLDEHIRFVLLTGVTKFSRVSIFSDLNNLNDISVSEKYAGLLGCTQVELEHYFSEYITDLAQKKNEQEIVMKDRIMRWYNGYRFSRHNIRLYNPFSLLLLFEHGDFKNYWFETGTPTFLVNLIKEKNYDLKNFEYEKVSELIFSSYEIEQLEPLSLLLQTGYLSISDYNEKKMQYTLSYPNYEVKQSFLSYLAASYSNVETMKVDSYLWNCVDALEDNNPEEFFETLKVFFANINYELHIKNEKYYQTIFYVIFKLLGLKVQTEVSSNIGRIDAVIELADKIYIFEFKIKDTAQNALKQIKANKYYQKYLRQNKDIICIGAKFDMDSRNIVEWVAE
ncbi:MAG: ATP-binding protein [Desulfobacula sp.]|jgi:hypothetical protein|nr:ATP-binding protein [Desulfobacula sp.]